MYWSINDLPEVKKYNRASRRKIVLMITKELSLGPKYALIIFISILLGVASTILVGAVTSNGDVIGYTAYSVFILSAIIGYLYIINVFVRKKIEQYNFDKS